MQNAKRRHIVPLNPTQSDFITAAEARGEAAYLVLEVLLRKIPRSISKSIMVQAYADADRLGIGTITSEVEAIFSNMNFEDQAF
jgi:hypothetical protein